MNPLAPPEIEPRLPMRGEGRRATSLVDLLAGLLAEAPDRRAIVDGLAAGDAVWTWGDVAAAAVHLAGILAAAGLSRGDRVVHIGSHSPDWIVVDLACGMAGMVHVALHADAGRGDHLAQCAWLEPRGVIFSGAGGPGGLKPADVAPGIVVDLSPGGSQAFAGLAAGAWRRLAADPRALRAAIDRGAADCDPKACATILLSSGTTGVPHGVMHSQAALVANATAAAEMFLDDPRDVRLSWLPMSHALARTGDLYTAMVRGGCLNVVPDRSRVLEACRSLPPTVILGVPAFFERLEQGVASGRIADLGDALGGNVRVCVSGAAPVRRRTVEFFKARGVPLVEGYGLAEAGPVVALGNPRIARPGMIGPPIPGVEVRIDTRKESLGQLLVKTPSRALGIIDPATPPGDPRAPVTGEVAEEEWLETGDLAVIDEAGHVRITGRLRDTLVLATGVKVPPAAVEAALAEDDAVAQVCVVNGAGPRPVALVVPEPDVLRTAIRRMGLRVVSRRQALGHPRVREWLARRLARRQRDLPKAWRVGAYVLVGRAFDAAHGEATESLKLRRDVIAAHFARPIARAEADRASGVGPQAPAGAGSREGSWLSAAVWSGAEGGFVAAAAATAAPLPDRVEAVLDRAAREIARLRAERLLYAPLPAASVAAPVDDPPPPPTGIFSVAAEEALGAAGLWGLAVPEAFAGCGASMLDLTRAITRLAADVPTAAGMLAVHSSIGAVSAITGFGTAEQQERLLPLLAAGRPLSIFGATEPDAGCDLGRIRAVVERRPGRLALTGTKMFITGATHGRLVKLLALLDGRPVVVLARLPAADTSTFRLRRYALHPLKHAHNAALEFTGFEIDPADVLDPGATGDAMRIVWHGLNRGRVTLAAQAAGTLRLLLAQARDHAAGRITWGQPIGSRQLVQGRLGRIAASIVACDALASWAATAIDAGQSGEWEAIVAKVVASHCVRDAAIDALGVHGGRAFLVGHPLGDSLHDHFAVSVYEGESDLLGLALFKGIAKAHPLAAMGRDVSPWRRAGEWLAWRAASAGSHSRHDAAILDRHLRDHAKDARGSLRTTAHRIDRAIRRHGRRLGERQLEVGQLAADVRDALSVLAVAHHADAAGDDRLLAPAEAWCRLAVARIRGGRPSAADFAAVADLGRRVMAGETFPVRSR
jgi:long-subunit acyl-CoA synthetase (AMP-forming)/alkylation response protein AidB-like acyl-CoA dehydrogenase